MFGKPQDKILFVYLLFIFSSICYADTRTDQPALVIEENDGTNAGRYRILKVSNGSTTNNNDGSISVSTSGGTSGLWETNNVGIDTFNNVGIGSTNPTQKLDVNGNGRFNNLILNGSGAGSLWSPNGLVFDPNNSTGTSLVPAITILTTGNVGIGTQGATTPSAPLQVGGNTLLSNIAGNELTFNLNGTNFGAFYNKITDSTVYYGATTAINTVPAVFPNILSLATDTGNVGVGTAVPHFQLDVLGTVRATGFVLPGNGVASGYVLTSNSVGVGTWMPASGGGGSGTINSGTTNRVAYYSGATTLSSGAGFNNGTNIGIGTILNTNLLDVAGGVSVGTTYAGYATSPANGVIIQGNVGIGTSLPQGGLDVEGTLSPAVFFGRQGNNVGIGTWLPTGALQVVATSAIAATFPGNVGIGSTNPGASLDVQGTLRITGAIATDWINSSGGNLGIGTTIAINLLDVAGGVVIGTTNAGYQTAPSNGLLVQGNIGIATINPGDALDVNGTLRIRGNFAGGSTGNVGIGTAVVNSSTCDSVCNTAGKRCFVGITVPLTGFEPCSATISGDCLCLPVS